MAISDERERTARAYALTAPDAVRETFERAHFARLLPRLLDEAGGGSVLELGCAGGGSAELAGPGLGRYVGVDLRPVPRTPGTGAFVVHDLREGLGPVGADPYDVYFGAFGIASHLAPEELGRLLADIADHARPGAIVALEALGRYSLEWPGRWSAPPGPDRVLAYRLAGEVAIHPWAPGELAARFAEAGIRPLRALDRTVQCGPKAGDGSYWPGLPPLRDGLNRLLAGDASGTGPLAAALPPLPAHPAAEAHHALAARRRRLLDRVGARGPRAIARAVWGLEPRSGKGLGHGLLVVGRVA